MANVIANNALGRWAEWLERVEGNDPPNSGFVIVALKASGTDDAFKGFDDLGALLGDAAFTEADFTNYARVVYTDTAALTRTVDDANDWVDVDFPDWTYSSAGGTLDNTLTDVVVGYDSDTTAGTDANILLMSMHDFAQATNGGDIDAQVAAAGLLRAA